MLQKPLSQLRHFRRRVREGLLLDGQRCFGIAQLRVRSFAHGRVLSDLLRERGEIELVGFEAL